MASSADDRPTETAAREQARREAVVLFEAAKRANDKDSANSLSLRALKIATEWSL